MGPKGKKRGLLEISEPSAKKQKKNHKSEIESKGIALDSLPWNEVAFPERFDDAEGFFGLEELSDVDVLRDEKLGRVEYRVKKGRKAGPRKTIPIDSDSRLGTTSAVERDYHEEEEWNGFEESKTHTNTETVLVSEEKVQLKREARRDEAKERRRLEKNTKKPFKKTKSKVLDEESSINSFAALKVENDEGGDVSAWENLDLSPGTLSALSRLNFSNPTPIQKAAIPQILDGHDVIGKASTGSGKTLAFGIPIYEQILKTRNTETHKDKFEEKSRPHSPVALILSPTRELALQLSSHLKNLCASDVSIATVTGGLSVLKQQRQITYADVIIGTPGRLWEVLNGDKALIEKLSRAQFLILDEADRLLSEGHFAEVEEILNIVGRKADVVNDESSPRVDNPRDHRQTLIFSATFQKDLQQKLAGKSKSFSSEALSNTQSMAYLLQKIDFREAHPQFIDVNPVSQMASNLREGIVECAGLEKDLYLYANLLLHPNTRVLVFTNSITSVQRLLPFLQNLNLKICGLHSQMPQKARLRSIERFSSPNSQTPILIATDVAARGLDLPAIDLIIHYHVPRTADMYVHRSGRTARADRSGDSLLLCAPEEVQGVRRLVAKVHTRNAIKSSSQIDDKKFFLRTLELDRRIIARLKPRVALAKKIADAGLAKEKKGHEDNWLKTAAEDLGVEYDSEEFAAGAKGGKGRGTGRLKRDKESRGLSKAELGSLRAELREELASRINVGVSERYLTAGRVDVDELLSGREGNFLGATGSVLNYS